MTSTNIFSGNFVDKPTSRVLKPPGGGHSNIFGLPEEQPKLPNAQKQPQPAEAQKETEENKPVINQDQNKQTSEPKDSKVAPENRSYKHKLSQGAFNPITGEPIGRQSEPMPEKPANSITVKQPPGGASSKLW